MTKKNLSLTQKKLIDTLCAQALVVSQKLQQYPIPTLIRLLRKRLHMTQKNLADRAHMPQSYIAKIESGRIKPNLKTLEKIFNALFCDLRWVAVPKESFDTILQKQTLKVAQSRIAYIQGTMSLEKQLPNEEMVNELVRVEQKRLLESESSEIWDE